MVPTQVQGSRLLNRLGEAAIQPPLPGVGAGGARSGSNADPSRSDAANELSTRDVLHAKSLTQ